MTKPFDPKAAIKAAKGHERILAYTGFDIHMKATEGEPYAREGFVKIASSLKAPGDGFLRLTFLVDTKSQVQKRELQALFKNLAAKQLNPSLRDNLEEITNVSLDELGDIREWFIEEVNVHLRNLRDYEKTIVEKDLFPAFEKFFALYLPTGGVVAPGRYGPDDSVPVGSDGRE